MVKMKICACTVNVWFWPNGLTDEGVIPETSQTNKTEHFFMNIFHIKDENKWAGYSAI